MYIEIDFNSDEAFYIQLRNQIIMGIATQQLQDGDPLPSVRSLAEEIGINMHTVNKTYSLLKQEGFIKLDRRKGAVVDVDVDHLKALEEVQQELDIILAEARCRGITADEIHGLVDQAYSQYDDSECGGQED